MNSIRKSPSVPTISHLLNTMSSGYNKKSIAIEFISFLFILLFVYAAISKLIDYEKFRAQIGQSPLLTVFADWLAWSVPLIEILIACLLIIPRLKLIGLYAAFSLMVMFTAYIIGILSFSDYVPCSCGGVLEKLSWTHHLIFNIGFTALAVAGIVVYYLKQDTQGPPSNKKF